MAFPKVAEIEKEIIEYLKKHGGSATTTELAEDLAKTFRLSRDALNKRVYHASRSRGESAWRLALRRARFLMIRGSKIRKSKTRGLWELA